MSFLTRATVAAFFMFALLSSARAQAPVQTSSQATALPPDNDFYSVREPAADDFRRSARYTITLPMVYFQ